MRIIIGPARHGPAFWLGAAALAVALTAFAAPQSRADDAHPEFAASRGGQLYDTWLKVTEGYEIPRERHPAYPAKGSQSRASSTWLCAECHGWDYKGKDGAYADRTDVKGLMAMKGAPVDKVVAALKNDTHGFNGDMMSDRDFHDLGRFVSAGIIDMDVYIDRATGKSKGDATRGRAYFDTVCSRCHAFDGRKDASVGKLARQEPWKLMHKMRSGEPLKEMPSLMAFEPQVAADILAYAQTLPD